MTYVCVCVCVGLLETRTQYPENTQPTLTSLTPLEASVKAKIDLRKQDSRKKTVSENRKISTIKHTTENFCGFKLNNILTISTSVSRDIILSHVVQHTARSFSSGHNTPGWFFPGKVFETENRCFNLTVLVFVLREKL